MVLAGSGAWLWWEYRPDRAQWIRDAHQVSAWALLVVAVALVVVAILRRGRARAPGVVAAVGVFVTVGAAFVTGRLLPWNSLALWYVTTGDDISGARAALASSVRAIGIDGREIFPLAYALWAYAHLALAGIVVLALVLVWFRARDPRPAADAELVIPS